MISLAGQMFPTPVLDEFKSSQFTHGQEGLAPWRLSIRHSGRHPLVADRCLLQTLTKTSFPVTFLLQPPRSASWLSGRGHLSPTVLEFIMNMILSHFRDS